MRKRKKDFVLKKTNQLFCGFRKKTYLCKVNNKII
nr:MAG TPA: hypothetical protein [Caudoviricetes sp.]